MENNISQLLDLSGKTAIVTGGDRGIGLGIAKRLAEAGASVMIASQYGDKCHVAAEKLRTQGYSMASHACDVSNESDVIRLIDATLAEFKHIDILINNAGIFPVASITTMSSRDFDNVTSTNLKGVFLCTKYASQEMIKRGKGGRIINITSIDALHPSMVGLAHYDASKHGVWGFTKNAALEFAPHKIWVNAIAPGAIDTPGMHEMSQGDIQKDFIAAIPMQRIGTADDIGKATLFLASDMASYITGTQLVVDGGMLLT